MSDITISNPISAADGPTIVGLGSDAFNAWHEIGVQVVDSSGVSQVPAAGVLTGKAGGIGSDVPEDFTESLNLVTGERRWKPFLSTVDYLEFEAVGLDVGLSVIVSIVHINVS